MNSCYPELIDQINNLIEDNNLALVLQKMESSIFIDKIRLKVSIKVKI